MKDSVRFIITCTYKTRAALIRGVARRILNAGRNSPIAYAQPSLAMMVSEIVEHRLNFPTKVDENFAVPKKSLIMLFLHKSIHSQLNLEAKNQGISATQLLINIIQSTDFKQVDVKYDESLKVEKMAPSSYNLTSECRYKINREIAKRMISRPTGLGKAEFENVGKIINEILASHFKIPLPQPEPQEPVVDNEQVKFTVFMNKQLHESLKDYCVKKSESTGEFVSVNATIIKWIEEAAEDEMW